MRNFGATMTGAASLLVFALADSGSAQERQRGIETSQDLPGDFSKYFGQDLDRYREVDRRLGKIDLDADLNQDGIIRHYDPGDSGAFEHTPPGLIIGKGEMSKVLIQLRPYRVDFEGDVVIGMEVVGVNRSDKSGRFNSLSEELAATGRVRIWSDKQKSELLLDSGNPEMRYREWVANFDRFPANLPGLVPRYIYVEGVDPSGAYLGDLRLLVTLSHRPAGSKRRIVTTDYDAANALNASTSGPATEQVDDGTSMFKRFRTSFDHILLTIENEPLPKQFVNDNAEGVWITAGGASSSDE